MASELNDVKTEARDRYHHGDLRESLIVSAEQILREKGVGGFSLREAARRTGVSPAAPAHHFGDSRGLLTAVAARGFRRLTEKLDSALEGVPIGQRLKALGSAYLEFACENPALFSMMWMRDLVDPDDEEYLSAGRAAFNVFERAATGTDVVPATAPRTPGAALVAAWATMHGLARLKLDGALANVPRQIEDEVLDLMPDPRNAGRRGKA